MGDFSADGRYLLYEDIKGFENEWRKHHTSSVTRDIVLYDFDNKSYKSVADWKGEKIVTPYLLLVTKTSISFRNVLVL